MPYNQEWRSCIKSQSQTEEEDISSSGSVQGSNNNTFPLKGIPPPPLLSAGTLSFLNPALVMRSFHNIIFNFFLTN